MKKSTKIALVVIVVLITISTLLSLAVNRIGVSAHADHYTDEYGWEHGAKTPGTTYQSDENLSRTYALIEYDKEKMAQMDAHTFISQVSSVLDSYKDGQWYYLTFVFGDGTGLYFPDSNINEPASYGEINEKGQITAEYGVVTISGMNISYNEMTSSYVSDDSRTLQECIPQEYVSDALSAIIQDNNIYISFYVPVNEIDEDGNIIHITPNEEMAKELTEKFYEEIKESGCKYLDSCDAIYIALANNRMGFYISKDGIATYSDELGDEIYNVIETASRDI